MKNRWGNINSINLSYTAYLCDEAANPGCSDYFYTNSPFEISIYIGNYYLDELDYEDPVKPDVLGTSSYITPGLFQTKFVFSKINRISTDISPILTETVEEEFYSVSDVQNNTGIFNPINNELFQVTFSVDQIISKTQRRYLKIQELLANMGGFFKAISLIANVLSFHYSEFTYYHKIFDLEAKSKAKINKINLNNFVGNRNESNSSQIGVLQPNIKVLGEKPSFFGYLKSLVFSKTKQKLEVDRQNKFKYIELEYLVDNLLFIEELRDKLKEKNKLMN